jgi:hypothetical protein
LPRLPAFTNLIVSCSNTTALLWLCMLLSSNPCTAQSEAGNGGVCMQLLDTLNEINERHEAVKQLNKSLVELSQMFTDMAVLVEQQGVMINNIESQVSTWVIVRVIVRCLCPHDGCTSGENRHRSLPHGHFPWVVIVNLNYIC